MQPIVIGVRAVVVAALAFVGLGFCGRWHYLPDLCSHFRIQATVALLGTSLLLLALKSYRWASVSGVAALILSATLAPFLWPARSVESRGGYRLVSLNVLTTNAHKERVTRFILDSDPHFVILMETDRKWIEALDAALAEGWPYRRVAPRSDNFGIAMYSKVPWESCEVFGFSAPRSTPAMTAYFDFPDGRPLRLVAAHPPPPMSPSLWKSRNLILEGVAQEVSTNAAPGRTILAGDLNCSPWSYWFAKLEADSGLRTSAIGRGLHVSWKPLSIPGSGLPIDHVLVGDRIRVSDSRVGPDIGSDHRAVIVDFE